MTITTGAALNEYGTQTTVISDASAIATTAFNAGTITALVQTDFVPMGDAVLTVNIVTTAPAAGAAFHLYRRDMNITSTNDSPVPDANYKNIYVGSFPLDLVTGVQYVQLCGIPLVVDQEFYIENGTDQSTTGTTVVEVTPRSYNVK